MQDEFDKLYDDELDGPYEEEDEYDPYEEDVDDEYGVDFTYVWGDKKNNPSGKGEVTAINQACFHVLKDPVRHPISDDGKTIYHMKGFKGRGGIKIIEYWVNLGTEMGLPATIFPNDDERYSCDITVYNKDCGNSYTVRLAILTFLRYLEEDRRPIFVENLYKNRNHFANDTPAYYKYLMMEAYFCRIEGVWVYRNSNHSLSCSVGDLLHLTPEDFKCNIENAKKSKSETLAGSMRTVKTDVFGLCRKKTHTKNKFLDFEDVQLNSAIAALCDTVGHSWRASKIDVKVLIDALPEQLDLTAKMNKKWSAVYLKDRIKEDTNKQNNFIYE